MVVLSRRMRSRKMFQNPRTGQNCDFVKERRFRSSPFCLLAPFTATSDEEHTYLTTRRETQKTPMDVR